MKRKYWTDEEVQYLKENYYSTDMQTLCDELDRSVSQVYNKAFILKLKRDPKFMDRVDNLLKHGAKTRFKKQHTPWNKGKKIALARNTGMFEKGNVPPNYKPVGTISLRADGYYWIKIADPGKWQLHHRVLWERAYGAIPEGMNIAFKNGNAHDIRLENLEMVSNKKNMQRNTLHQYPDDIKGVIRARAVLSRHINKLNNQDDEE